MTWTSSLIAMPGEAVDGSVGPSLTTPDFPPLVPATLTGSSPGVASDPAVIAPLTPEQYKLQITIAHAKLHDDRVREWAVVEQ